VPVLSNSLAFRATVALIWALALWHSWVCRGLFVDGAAFLVQIVRFERFMHFYPPRIYAMYLTELPIMAGIWLGLTDLHWLGRLLSLGLFALPTFFYTLALHRARHDAVLLAVVIAGIGTIFMSTSFFIVGEFNIAYALALCVAVRLATVDRLQLWDGLVLVAIGVLATRTYEAMLYLGPVLAAMIVWQVIRVSARPLVPLLLHLASAALFLVGMVIAADAVIHPWLPEHRDEAMAQAKFFWQDIEFAFPLIALLVLSLWGLLRPNDLAIDKPYRRASIALALLALSPLLALGDGMFRPLARSHYLARSASGVVITVMVIFIWCQVAPRLASWRPRVVLRMAEAGRRMLAFAALLLVAAVPADVFLTFTWVDYLDAMRATVSGHGGVIAFEDTPISKFPKVLMVENWTLPSQSLMLRSKPGDGIIAPPRNFTEWTPFPPSEPVDIGRFFWRD
jgi:hypothetical protein